jgi:hypothetical protein
MNYLNVFTQPTQLTGSHLSVRTEDAVKNQKSKNPCVSSGRYYKKIAETYIVSYLR